MIYGTAWKKLDTERLVAQAITQGFRAIDTACQPKHYNEPGVGAGIAAALKAGASPGLTRADLFVQTKFTPLSSQDPKQLPYDADASLGEQVAQSFAASLRNLQTDYLDSLVLHSPLPTERETLQAWQVLEAIVDAGQARQIGISNCYSVELFESLYNAARIKPAVLQNRFHDKTGYDRELRALCRERGIRYQSFWTLTANPHITMHRTVESIATRLQRTTEQVFFRYLTQIGVTPLTGTTSVEHMKEDLAICEFALSSAEIEAISLLF